MPGALFEVNDITDAASNQVAIFRGNERATAASNDEAYFSHYLDNDAGTQVEAVRHLWELQGVSAGSEDGAWRVKVLYNGALYEQLDIDMGATPNPIINFNL